MDPWLTVWCAEWHPTLVVHRSGTILYRDPHASHTVSLDEWAFLIRTVKHLPRPDAASPVVVNIQTPERRTLDLILLCTANGDLVWAVRESGSASDPHAASPTLDMDS